ncbi:acyltransferase family protein [Marinobacter pelagius]|uniref:Peptidoglycan/LPS O-acetylase OafA/YrhL, contains acyltransferase and SGNH-hydrolase domains n=1 Tax=Marinobacter pelagius TaxID=379482 RepID=A0A1I4UIY2_9GAMM|nr:acyltransferase family protein [Marinobacter pelagius]SFM88673.1 Peptidoglycan/LPS O-acetylase OafA/YrhL, contains acyltransferase and SGNH-hydrolase domains [Marinobacter pelagius]
MKPRHTHRIPEIEGLRAIAVLAVVLYHAGVTGLSGGFTGVDVFFVISGYVFTRLLLHELAAQGSIDLFSFYAKRAKRLFPALLFMVVAVCSLSFILLSPTEQETQQNSAIASLIWANNLYLSFSDSGYFDPAQEYNLFLHTWSLGVEEQFYLLWPFFLLAGSGVLVNRYMAPDMPRLFRLLTLAAVLGFCFSVFLTLTNPVWAFFLPISRVWQFSLGALIVVSDRIVSREMLRRNLVISIQMLGGILLCVSFFYLHKEYSYPGVFALLPSLGCAMIIFSLKFNFDTPLNRVLRSKIFITIGGLSYSWYLWHWPVLVFGWILIEPFSGLNIFLVCASLMIASFSYRYVETPFRYSVFGQLKPIGVLLVFASVSVLAWGAAGAWKERTGELIASSDQGSDTWATIDFPAIYELGCDDWFHSSDVKYCTFGSEKAKRTAVLVGDSIAAQWFPALNELFSHGDWRLVVATKSSCPMIQRPFFYERINRYFTECEEWRKKVIATLEQYEPTIIFLGSSSGYPYSRKEWEESGMPIVRAFANIAEGQLMMISPTPKLGFSGPECVSRNRWAPAFVERNCSTQLGSKAPPLNQALEYYKEAVNKVTVLNFNNLVCPEGVCSAKRDNIFVYRDSSHLTASFVNLLTPQIRQIIRDAGVPGL